MRPARLPETERTISGRPVRCRLSALFSCMNGGYFHFLLTRARRGWCGIVSLLVIASLLGACIHKGPSPYPYTGYLSAADIDTRVDELLGGMVALSGGSFRMGDLSGAGYDVERPVHNVTVPAFRMGKYEVTFTQWDACVADGGCDGYRPYAWSMGRGNRPVFNVSWDDTREFINWLSVRTGERFRLPSEAEWEYAARAGSTTEYSWGHDISESRANYCTKRCGHWWYPTNAAEPVGSFPANAWGLHDMHGNVWEWVQDCWHYGYAGAPRDGSAWISGGDCDLRMLRGGSSLSEAWNLRSAYRGWHLTVYRKRDIGFRLA